MGAVAERARPVRAAASKPSDPSGRYVASVSTSASDFIGRDTTGTPWPRDGRSRSGCPTAMIGHVDVAQRRQRAVPQQAPTSRRSIAPTGRRIRRTTAERRRRARRTARRATIHELRAARLLWPTGSTGVGGVAATIARPRDGPSARRRGVAARRWPLRRAPAGRRRPCGWSPVDVSWCRRGRRCSSRCPVHRGRGSARTAPNRCRRTRPRATRGRCGRRRSTYPPPIDSPLVKPTATRAGMPSERIIAAYVPANCSQ